MSAVIVKYFLSGLCIFSLLAVAVLATEDELTEMKDKKRKNSVLVQTVQSQKRKKKDNRTIDGVESHVTSCSAKEAINSSSLVLPDQIILTKGKGSKKTGGGIGGYYWTIMCNSKRAGKVFINMVDNPPLGKHPSIQIYLNKASQRKHIGRWAYQKACFASQYDVIYAHISKKNLASSKAAAAAGFEPLNLSGVTQLIMRWKRP